MCVCIYIYIYISNFFQWMCQGNSMEEKNLFINVTEMTGYPYARKKNNFSTLTFSNVQKLTWLDHGTKYSFSK